jgi:hypothetical protein
VADREVVLSIHGRATRRDRHPRWEAAEIGVEKRTSNELEGDGDIDFFQMAWRLRLQITCEYVRNIDHVNKDLMKLHVFVW